VLFLLCGGGGNEGLPSSNGFRAAACRSGRRASGCSLRRARSKRTFGRRAAGLRPAEARCAHSGANSSFKIQDSKLSVLVQLATSIPLGTSPQPSGWACDAKEQPPPGGGCGLRHPFRVQIQNSKLNSGRSLRSPPATIGSCGPPRREAASCGGFLRSCKFRIQNSIGMFSSFGYRFGPELAKGTHERTRAAGLRGAKLRPAAVPFRNRKFMIQN